MAERQGFLSKIPFFKFVSKSKFSVSNVNKYYVGVKPQPTLNCVGRIWKRSIKDSPCHPELAAPLVADEKEAYKGGCSQSISGSSHRQKCSAICTQKTNVGLKAQPTLISVLPRRRSIVMQCLRPHSPRRVAFTLAEVLITLGIIGVVAAMTLPTLIANHQQKVTVTKLKKVYSILNQAYLRAQNDNGTIDNWGLSKSQFEEDPDTGELVSGEQVVEQTMLFWSKFQPYLQVLKTCTDTTSDAQCEGYSTYSLDGKKRTNDRIPRLILNDGIILSGVSIDYINNCNNSNVYCADFSVDINGTAPPNTTGRDIFYFYVFKNRITPMGAAGPELIRSFEDFCNRTISSEYNGYGCAAWVIYNENMDYLKCDGLSWSGKHKCK